MTVGLFLLSGCSEEKTQTFYNPSAVSLPTPSIQSVTPSGSAVAGIDTITVKGSNFSTTPSQNFVVFNAQPAQVVQATPTEIRLIAPLLVSDSVVIRVSVQGAFDFSNKIPYALKAAVAVFGDLATNELSSTVAADPAGNVYSGFSLNGAEAGVLRFTPAGVRSTFAPKTAGDWTSLKIGPGGYLYAVKNIRAIYRFSPNGGSPAAVWAQVSGMLFADFDFDQSGNLWTGGNNANIYRFAPDKSVTSYPFAGNIRALRVFAGYLYFAAKTDAGEKIWRAQITASGLGTPEVYFDLPAAYAQAYPLAMTFSADGDLYLGINSQDGIMVVTPGKTWYTPLTVYKKLFGKGVKTLAWGKGTEIFCSTVDGLILKINVTGKTSAPYYGAGL